MGYFAPDQEKVAKSKKKLVLIMDEVDGMSAGDRGGVVQLASFCRKTNVSLYWKEISIVLTIAGTHHLYLQ
jgi:replication factor C subunit 1